MKIFNSNNLRQEIEDRWVIKKKHPSEDLYIYNYSPEAQFKKHWNEITMACRGLILDGDENIVSRPFRKFFNIEEIDRSRIPNEPYEVQAKVDGSLGILYWINNAPYIATRGSFDSQQAHVATEILKSKYSHIIPSLKRDRTYLFEIIYPENRIVVDYGDRSDIILIAIIDNATGKDLPMEYLGFQTVEKYQVYNVKNLYDLKDPNGIDTKNKEGFVIKFESGLRIKIKFEHYIMLHRIVTGTSEKTIWEMLSQGNQDFIHGLPDELYTWSNAVADKFIKQYREIENAAFSVYGDLPKTNRKEFAIEAIKHKNISAVLFNMLDGKDYTQIIWNLIKPIHAKSFFRKEIDTE